MSVRALAWAYRQHVGNPLRKAVLVALAHHHHKETGRCFPSEETIAAQTETCLSMKLSKAAETQRMSHRGFQSLCHIRVRTVQLPPTSL